MKKPKYSEIVVPMTGEGGLENASAILARTIRIMKEADFDKEVINAFQIEAMGKSYNALVATVMKWFSVE